jgi:hypothetical protein
MKQTLIFFTAHGSRLTAHGADFHFDFILISKS